MIKLPITFEDFDGNTQTKDVYFHLSRRELLDYDAPAKKRRLEQLQEKFGDGSNIDENDPESYGPFLKEYLDIFEDLLAPAYGIRVDDANGQSFVKDETTRNITQTAWYQDWLFQIAQQPDQMGEIIQRLMPKDVIKEVEAEQARQGSVSSRLAPKDHLPKQQEPVQNVSNVYAEETPEQMEARIRAQLERKFAGGADSIGQ